MVSRRIKRGCLFFCFLAFSPLAFGLTINLGLNMQNFDYEEHLAPPSKSKESGRFFSFHSEAIWGLSEGQSTCYRLIVDISPLVNLNYDGSTLPTGTSPSQPVSTTNKHFFAHTEAYIDQHVHADLLLFLGIGYRIWNRYLTYGTGYREFYTWYYFSLGGNWTYYRGQNWNAGIELSYRPTAGGKLQIVFSEFVVTGKDSYVDLGSELGFKVSLPIGFSVGEWKLKLVPWYEMSEIGRSQTVYNSTPIVGGGELGYIYEPPSRTHRIGILTSATFQF